MDAEVRELWQEVVDCLHLVAGDQHADVRPAVGKVQDRCEQEGHQVAVCRPGEQQQVDIVKGGAFFGGTGGHCGVPHRPIRAVAGEELWCGVLKVCWEEVQWGFHARRRLGGLLEQPITVPRDSGGSASGVAQGPKKEADDRRHQGHKTHAETHAVETGSLNTTGVASFLGGGGR